MSVKHYLATDSAFGIIDLQVNYEITPDLSSVGTINQLTKLTSNIGASPATIYFRPGDYKLLSFTFPENFNLIFAKGAKLVPDLGQTITINGALIAGAYQIFSGDGSIIINSKVERFYPQWFGEPVTTTVIDKLIAAMPLYGGDLYFIPGEYTLTITLPIYPKVINIKTAGMKAVTFTPPAINTPIFIASPPAANTVLGNVIGGFTIKPHALGSTGGAILLSGVRFTKWENIDWVDNGGAKFDSGFIFDATGLCYANTIDRLMIDYKTPVNTLIKFTNSGGFATNANLNYIKHLWINQSGISMIIDAGDSTLTEISDCEFEGNAAATVIIPGQKTVIKRNWFEGNLNHIAPKAAGERSVNCNAVTVKENHFATDTGLTIPTDISGWQFTDNGGTLTIIDNGNNNIVNPLLSTIQRDFTAAEINFGGLAAGASQEIELVLVGAKIGDTVIFTPSNTVTAGFIWQGYCALAGHVRIRGYNATAGAIDPDGAGGITWRCEVLKRGI